MIRLNSTNERVDTPKVALEVLRRTYAWGTTACVCSADPGPESKAEFDALLALVMSDPDRAGL